MTRCAASTTLWLVPPAKALPRATLLLAALLAVSPVAARGAPAPAADARGEAVVKLRDDRVLVLRAPLAGRSAGERARAASRALLEAVQSHPDARAEVHLHGEVASIHVGAAPVLELGPDDAAAAGAADLAALAHADAARIDRALEAEQRRAATAEWVFHVSLVVFSGLIVFLLLRKIGDLDRALERWLRERHGGVPQLRLRGVTVVSSAGMAGAMSVGLRLGRYLLQLLVGYGWLVFALSLFPATRGAGVELGRYVVAPTLALLGRLGGSLPTVVGAAVGAGVLWMVLRGVRLFFESVSRGETHLHWLPPEVASPVGDVVRLGVVVAALAFAAPVLTGTSEGALSQLGTMALLAVALGAAPALAAVAAGLPRVLQRTYRPGQSAEIGRASGVVQSVDLLGVELRDASGARILVPHLAALVAPTRLRDAVPARLEVVVDPAEDQARVRELLAAALPGIASVEMTSLDAGGVRYRISGGGDDLAVRVAAALRDAGVRLGRGRGPEDA